MNRLIKGLLRAAWRGTSGLRRPLIQKFHRSLDSSVELAVERSVTRSVAQAVGPAVDLSVGPAVDLSVGPAVARCVGPAIDLSVGPAVERSVEAVLDQSLAARVSPVLGRLEAAVDAAQQATHGCNHLIFELRHDVDLLLNSLVREVVRLQMQVEVLQQSAQDAAMSPTEPG